MSYFCKLKKIHIMCTYSISVDDTILERVKPALPDDKAVEAWMQSQVDILLLQLAETVTHQLKAQDDLPSRIRRISNIHRQLNQKQEHASSEERVYSPELETILAMPLLDKADVGLNGEQARMDYYKEKYSL